jgi:hypothetical protein
MRRARTAAIATLATVLVLGGVACIVLNLTVPLTTDRNPVSNVIYLSNPIVLASVGGLLAIRMPGHWAGWTLLGVALVFDLDSFSTGVLAHYAADESRWSSWAPWAAWQDNWLWTLTFGALLFIILKFAEGTDNGRRLRAAGWAGMFAFALLFILAVCVPRNDTYKNVQLPFDTGLSMHFANAIVLPLFLSLLAASACAVVALVVRWRHCAGADRAQLRWMLWAFGWVVASLVMEQIVESVLAALHSHAPLLDGAVDVIAQLSLFTIPIAMYVSVTRYGLFEIDRVVSRTASYSVLTALLTISYVGIVTAATRLLPGRFNSFGVALATLAVAALFLPVRRRLVAVMDRRFNRGRVNAEQIISAFAERVRHEDANDPSGKDLLAAAHAVFQPSRASVWLMPR